MNVYIFGIRELCVENVAIQSLDDGISIYKDSGESLFLPNHHISSIYNNGDNDIAVAVKMTKKQFALLESFILNLGGVSL